MFISKCWDFRCIFNWISEPSIKPINAMYYVCGQLKSRTWASNRNHIFDLWSIWINWIDISELAFPCGPAPVWGRTNIKHCQNNDIKIRFVKSNIHFPKLKLLNSSIRIIYHQFNATFFSFLISGFEHIVKKKGLHRR